MELGIIMLVIPAYLGLVVIGRSLGWWKTYNWE